MFGQGGEQKQNKQNGGGRQENNNNHDQKRWFLVCEADYMATNLNNTGDDPQPINLMREDPDQYYKSCDDDRDYTHSSNGNNNHYSPFFNVNVFHNNHTTSSNDLFHLRNRQSRLLLLYTANNTKY
jgi:hypothetical protein